MKCYQYWPNDGKTEMYGTVTVKSMEEKLYAFFTKRKLEVSQEGVKIITRITYYLTTVETVMKIKIVLYFLVVYVFNLCHLCCMNIIPTVIKLKIL